MTSVAAELGRADAPALWTDGAAMPSSRRLTRAFGYEATEPVTVGELEAKPA